MAFKAVSIASAVLANAEPPALNWWDNAQADTVCSRTSGVCHSFGHFVFLASPFSKDPTTPLDGVTRFGIDDGKMQAADPPMFERHLVTGICVGDDHSNCTEYGPSQVFQTNWLTVQAMSVDADGKFVPPTSLPKKICAEADVFEATKPDDLGYAPKICADFTEPLILDDQDISSVKIELNSFSTVATSVPSGTGYQTDLHVMFFAVSANPTHELTAGGEYSIDGWETSSSAVGVYEKHINLRDDGLYYQAFQFNSWLKSDDVVDSEICYSIRVQDSVTAVSQNLKGCLTPCHKLVPFHNAAGYCPAPLQV